MNTSRNVAKRIAIASLFICIIAIVVLSVRNNWLSNQRVIIAQDDRDTGIGRTYGYKIEKYLFRDGLRITLWERLGLNKALGHTEMWAVYDVSGLKLDKVQESEWIKSDGAIYLNLQITYEDSSISTHPAKIIYDFHRGEMYVSSEYTLWRLFSDSLRSEDWMSDAEFESVLAELRR
jgi:hypothetical protein